LKTCIVILRSAVSGLTERVFSRVRAGSLGLSIGLAGLTAGCEMTDGELLGLAARTVAPEIDDSRVGRAVDIGGQTLINSEQAKKGRTRVDVYNNGNGNYAQKKEVKPNWTGKSIRDYSNTGAADPSNGYEQGGGTFTVYDGGIQFISEKNSFFSYPYGNISEIHVKEGGWLDSSDMIRFVAKGGDGGWKTYKANVFFEKSFDATALGKWIHSRATNSKLNFE